MFADGSEVEADVVVYCTGYKVTFPFFDPALIAAPDNDLPLFRRVFHPDARRACSSSGCCSRSARSCRSPRRSRSGSATTSPAATRCPPAREMRADIERERARDVQALRRLQAPHDAGRLRRLPRGPGEERRRGAERARERGHRLPVPPRRGDGAAGVTAPARAGASGPRRPTAPRSSPPRARSSPSTATTRPACATSSAAPTSRRARSTTTSRTRRRSSARSSRRRRRGAPARARGAPRAPDADEFVEGGYRAYFEFIVEDPETFAFLRRNAGTIRALFGDARAARGHRRAAPRTCAPAIARGAAAGGRRRLLRARDGRRRARARRAAGRARPARRRGRDALRHGAVCCVRRSSLPLAWRSAHAFPVFTLSRSPARCRAARSVSPPRPPSRSGSPRTSRRCSRDPLFPGSGVK